MRLRLLLLALLLCACARPCAAHPVAQGAMEIVVLADRVSVRARVPLEEVFVAEAFGAGPAAADPEVAWSRHGDYLLQHLHAQADATPLTGRVRSISPPPARTPESQITYALEYALPAGAPPPRAFQMSQDVLNEFEFAPGNPWEATYIATLGQDGQPARGGLLFTRKEPLSLTCDWSLAPAAGATRIDSGELARAYLRHGVMHILEGWDHLLFMAGLVLAAATLLDLLKVVTAFTLAHTVTLTLSVLNVVRLPPHLVEPMIAASIVFVALQNLFWPKQSRGWSRLLVAFGFGLFHGLGFAGGLLDAMAGMPGLAVTAAIASFSLGVELGHQVLVLPLFGTLRLLRDKNPAQDAERRWRAPQFASAAVCFAGVYYLLMALR